MILGGQVTNWTLFIDGNVRAFQLARERKVVPMPKQMTSADSGGRSRKAMGR